MAFQAWSYILLFFSLIALNHKYGKPYDDTRAADERRRARTLARMDEARAEAKAADAAARGKRKQARAARRREEERMGGIRGMERRWMYGHHSRA
ncbi:hypothetical protein LTR53_014684 [Teratosphaeriaceae sp. CCFEE 6253]|nr:hypothetical protein LTR53_014684 [Teratosphaeriaceae sp. CCFEE 6253]